MTTPCHVVFVFASRGIGGAERSMLRLMAEAHPERLLCRVIVPAAENGELRSAVRAIGVPYHAVAAWDLPRLFWLLATRRPDVAYVFGRFRTVVWALVARLAGVRCIVAAERSAASRWSDRLARWLDRRLVNAYVANSEFAARNLRAMASRSGPPVIVVPNGVERGGDSGRSESGGAASLELQPAPALLCVGNISPHKGQGVLLDAVHVLRARYPGLRVVLLGRDFTGGRFFAKARARGLEDTYVAAGFVDDVRPYLARASVVVLPSLTREGMPASVLEAMRAGVPVVASNVGGVAEIVENERTGLLVPPGDPLALAAAVGRLLGNDALRSRLATEAQRRVIERHGVGAMVDGHIEAFRQARMRAGAVPRREPPADPVPVSVAHVTTVDLSLRYLLLNQIWALRSVGYRVVGISSPGPEVAALEVQGIAHEAVPMTRRFTPLADLSSLVRLYRLFRRRRFTIVHTHNPKPGLLGQVAARLAGIPVVVNTLHGFYFHERMRPWVRRFYVLVERLAARCSDVILSQNEEDVETAVREGIARRDQILHLGNGIDLGRFDPERVKPRTRVHLRAGLGIPQDAPVVGFVGRLVGEKGVRELLAAARLVLDRVPAARFLLVGGDDVEKADHLSPPALARELNVLEACVFTGVRQDMPQLYAVMDVFALPSHREGFPRAPMEASAMGVPCVVTDIRGCRQVVTDGRNGLLVPVGDHAALADALLALLLDPERARALGAEGRRRARAEFDERRVFAKVMAEYDRLLDVKGLSASVARTNVQAAAGL